MIAERSNGITTTSTIVGQSYQAGIDDEDMAKIITMFTDLYSDPIAAVVREYSTNAHDAQVEAGISRPIEVTTPTSLSPFLRVKDYGVGLDAENIGRVYSRYGKSTKDKSNTQNGMFGIGCKAALTYTTQFTVESVKDGMRTICSIAREDGGVPVFTVVASVPDNGPNGTEVIIPAARHQHGDFERKARELYAYWPAGSVLLNGTEPDKVDGLRLSDDILLVKTDGYSYNRKPTVVVMGNVAYPVDTAHLALDLPYAYYAVISVPIGSVDLPPARESLMYTKLTKETLADIPRRFAAAKAAAIQKEIDKAATRREALKVVLQWRELLGNARVDSFKYRGQQMPEKVAGNFRLVRTNSRKLSASESAPQGLNVEWMQQAMIFVGYDAVNFTATHKRKLLQYVDEKGLATPDFFVLAGPTPDMTWLDQSQIHQWADVKAVKLPRAVVTRSGRPTGSYDAYMGSTMSRHIQADEIDDTLPLYYSRGRNTWETSSLAEAVLKAEPDAQIVCMPENRYAKFMRNFPAAKNVRDGVQAAYDAWAATLTSDQRTALAIRNAGALDALKRFDAAKVDDPDLKKAITLAKTVDITALMQARRAFASVMHSITEVADADWESPLDKYTLLEDIYVPHVSPSGWDHLYLYLNAAYKAAA